MSSPAQDSSHGGPPCGMGEEGPEQAGGSQRNANSAEINTQYVLFPFQCTLSEACLPYSGYMQLKSEQKPLVDPYVIEISSDESDDEGLITYVQLTPHLFLLIKSARVLILRPESANCGRRQLALAFYIRRTKERPGERWLL